MPEKWRQIFKTPGEVHPKCLNIVMSILVADLGGVEVLFSKIAQEVWKIARDMIFHFIVISGGKKILILTRFFLGRSKKHRRFARLEHQQIGSRYLRTPVV